MEDSYSGRNSSVFMLIGLGDANVAKFSARYNWSDVGHMTCRRNVDPAIGFAIEQASDRTCEQGVKLTTPTKQHADR